MAAFLVQLTKEDFFIDMIKSVRSNSKTMTFTGPVLGSLWHTCCTSTPTTLGPTPRMGSRLH